MNIEPLQNYKLLSPYRLNRRKVKSLMALQDLDAVGIARLKGIPYQHLIHNLSGRGRNQNIQEAVANVLGVPLEEIVEKVENGSPEAPCS